MKQVILGKNEIEEIPKYSKYLILITTIMQSNEAFSED